MSEDYKLFMKGKSTTTQILPEILRQVSSIQEKGKVAWLGVGVSSIFVGFSEHGASAPYLNNAKDIPYPGISGKMPVSFRNGVWAKLNEEFHIKPSAYTFREVK